MDVRPGRSGEGAALQDVERAAGLQFHQVGMASIAEDGPPPLDELEQAIGDGRIWVAEDAGSAVLGYAHMILLPDGSAHLEQVSVHPSAQGLGNGRALVDAVVDRARDTGARTLTLTTFRDVDWNRPLYEHLGFVVVREDRLSTVLREVRAHEISCGLDAAGARVAMRLTI